MAGSKRTIRFAYYDCYLEVAIAEENLVQIVEAAHVEALADPEEATRQALAEPIGTETLSVLLSGKDSVLVAVPDHTRRTNLAPVLSVLLEELHKLGFGSDRVKMIVAGGTHLPMSEEELNGQWGTSLTASYTFLTHNWNDPAELINLGQSKLGIPLEFNKVLFNDSLVIGLGTVKPHPVAGWSGGAKIILPGLAGKATTDYLHWTAAAYPVENIFGQADNPVRRELEETVSEIGLDLVINAIENRKGDIVALAAGDYIETHRHLVNQARAVPLIDLPLEQPEAMIVGGGIDRPELWEAMAGLYVANLLLQEGGTLVLVAACPNGVAGEHPEVLTWGYRSYADVKALVEKGLITDLTAASHLALVGEIIKRKKFRTVLVSSGINPADAKKLGLDAASDLDEALELIWHRHGSQAKILCYERI